MVDLVITPASVVKGAGAKTIAGILGEAVTAGQSVYRDASTKKFLKADSDSATAGVRAVVGVALNGGALNQPVVVQYDGEIAIGAALTVGERYFASSTPGGIMPSADLSAGEYVSLIGIAVSVSNMKLAIVNSGAAVPA